jgi:hypothetical protein
LDADHPQSRVTLPRCFPDRAYYRKRQVNGGFAQSRPGAATSENPRWTRLGYWMLRQPGTPGTRPRRAAAIQPASASRGAASDRRTGQHHHPAPGDTARQCSPPATGSVTALPCSFCLPLGYQVLPRLARRRHLSGRHRRLRHRRLQLRSRRAAILLHLPRWGGCRRGRRGDRLGRR